MGGHVQKFDTQILKTIGSTFTWASPGSDAGTSRAFAWLGATLGAPLMIETTPVTTYPPAGIGWFDIPVDGADYIAIFGDVGWVNPQADVTWSESRLVAMAQGVPVLAGSAIDGVTNLPGHAATASLSEAWKGWNLAVVGSDWLGQGYTAFPQLSSTLSDQSILNALPASTATPSLRQVFQFFVGRRQHNMTGDNIISNTNITYDLPRTTGLEHVRFQMRIGLTVTNATGGSLDVDMDGSLFAVKFREVTSVHSKQVAAMGNFKSGGL